MKVLVIGAGNMGLTYAQGMSKSKFLKKRNIMILDNSPEKTMTLRKISHFDVFDTLEECLPKADLVFVAVKPYHCEELFEKMAPLVDNEQVFISIMAGIKIATIQEALKVTKVVRAMPNLPSQVGKGMTSFTASKEVSRLELLTIEGLLDTTGRSVKVSNEEYIDASTGISGSGPAYVFYFMQSMMEAAQEMGFNPKDSKTLVTQTFEGAVELFTQSDISPSKWMERVASKGGTTRAALDSMEDNNVKDLIKQAAYAAFDRAVELGEE